jgi:hypothetical protein
VVFVFTVAVSVACDRALMHIEAISRSAANISTAKP